MAIIICETRPYSMTPKEIEHKQIKDCKDLLTLIRDRELVAPALVMLELYRPLAGIGDALMIFAQPFLRAFSLQQGLLNVLRSRGNIDWLITELEKSRQSIPTSTQV